MKTLIIKKPLYGTFCYIRDSHLKGKNLKVIIPQGSAVIDCKEWISTGKKMEKVFLIPNKPMILWGNSVKIEVNEKENPRPIKKETLADIQPIHQEERQGDLFHLREEVRDNGV